MVSDNDRYRDMAETFGQVARRGTTCGMHVHVAIESAEEGVRCLDRIAPWLPVLLAMSANSPYAEGRDTGYASWRTQLWSTWPSAGPTEAFGSVAGYRRACDRMIASGAARDTGMLYFDARLSEGQPTLEVRVLDAVTDPEDVGLLTALVRALVETAAVDGWPDGQPRWRAEELRAARWRASRYGTTDHLLDPVTHELRPAREVVSALVDLVAAPAARRPATPSGWRRAWSACWARRGRPGSGRPTSGPARWRAWSTTCWPARRTRGPPPTRPELVPLPPGPTVWRTQRAIGARRALPLARGGH